jgi:aminopeptidase N
VLILEQAKLDDVVLGEKAFDASSNHFVLHSPPKGDFKLTLVTTLDPSANTKLMGLYLSNGTYCTQCEAEGFRRITYFLDRPDVLSIYTTRIEADKKKAPILLGNGNPVESGDIEKTDRHYAIWHDPHPKPCYLFAMVAGNLDAFKDTYTTGLTGKKVNLAIWVEPGKEPYAAYAMDALKRSMKWDEDVFGLEYDLDVFNVVAVSDFNMGAMENKGLNIFNDKYVLATPETATDIDYAHIEGVIAHEYFHNWTGNRITCRDWFQLCLKEGLTVYRDQEFSADMRSRPVKRISTVRGLWAHQFSEDAGPLAHSVRPQSYREINNFYTATIYEKGAEIVRMLEVMLGKDAFHKALDLYFKRFDGQAATIEDFISCFEEIFGRKLDDFMLWYSQAGTPELVVEESFNKSSGVMTINFTQSTPATPGQRTKESLPIPVRFGLLNGSGEDIDCSGLTLKAKGGSLRDDVFTIEKAEAELKIKALRKKPVLSLLRNYSAPVKIEIQRSAKDIAFLATHDSDLFNRWRAAQELSMRELVSATAKIKKKQTSKFTSQIEKVLKNVLEDDDLSSAFKAQILSLPSESDIAREIKENVDPSAISDTRKALCHTVAEALQNQLLAAFESCHSDEPFSPDAEQAGRRSLKHVALDLLAAVRVSEVAATAFRLFQDANNMTDKFGALSILVRHNLTGHDEALDAFHAAYAKHPLVLDKWFSVQAMAPGENALERVHKLMEHPAFSLNTPNRVRALIGSFAAGNPTQFNRFDGKGYHFVADQVLQLDSRNPQVAARLLSSFRSWRALEPNRKAAAKAALERIASHQGLSNDVSDIVNRSLS